MKKVLSYALFIGVAVAGGLAGRDKPKDQTQAWADYYRREKEWKEAYEAQLEARKPKYASIMLDPEERWRAELYYKYRPKPVGRGLTPMAQEEFDKKREKIDRMFASSGSSSGYASDSSISQKPDLSGMYISIPLTGPESGEVIFNYVSGPH